MFLLLDNHLEIFLIFQALGIFGAVDAVMRPRSSQGAIAWVLALLLLPILSLPFYLIFGNFRFYGYVRARRILDRRLHVYLEQYSKPAIPHELSKGLQNPDHSTIELLCRNVFIHGNKLELLINGSHAFPDMLEAIKRAERYVLIQFYIFRHDKLGRELVDLLCLKARQGLKVYFLIDKIGSHSFPSAVLKTMRESGIETAFFRATRLHMWRLQINFRNHRKIVVVDGLEMFLGGLNIGEEYRSGRPELRPWRDTHLNIIGPAALQGQLVFLEDWNWATGEVPEVDWTIPEAMPGHQSVLFAATGPADEWDTCRLIFLHAINTAQKRLWIASPYLVPDEAIISAFQMAVLRNVDIRIITTGPTDNRFVAFAGYSYFSEILGAGVKIYRYQKGMMHQKVLLLDDEFSSVGSANLDQRSFALNFEVLAWVRDRTFALEVEEMLLGDFEKCQMVSSADWKKLPWIQRFLASIARLFAPIL